MPKSNEKLSVAKLKARIHHLERALSQHHETQLQNIPYTNQREILEALCEVSAGVDTYAFLGELFFEFLAQEVRNTSPSDERLKLYINTRHEIHELYTIARAARALRQKGSGK